MSQKEEARVRPMTREEVDLAAAWAAEEGWNPGLHDADCFYRTDPGGFFLLEVDGEPAGSISAVNYDETFNFAGFYIIRPEHRHKGYNFKLMEAVAARLGDRNIGIDGVVAQQENYKKSGFRIAYRNIRFGGVVAGRESERLADLREIDFGELMDYDARCFPVRRETFLKCWIAMPNAVGLAYKKEGRLAGYGMLRSCVKGFKIGPLFADDAGIAEELLLALALQADGAELFLDVPEPNRPAVELARRYGLEPVFETARMYLKGEPQVALDKIFGVTTFELG